jgi:predicted P-loop ATPase
MSKAKDELMNELELINDKPKKSNSVTFLLEVIDLEYSLRYNESINDIEYIERGMKEWRDLDVDNFWVQLRQADYPVKMSDLKSVLKSDIVPKFNEMQNYFERLSPVDSDSGYIEELSRYVHIKESDRERFTRHFKKHVVRMVKQVFQPNYFNKHCFTLISPGQNLGKTSFIRFMCPPEFQTKFYTENFALGGKIGKDDMLCLCENLMINIDELSVLTKADINQLKSIFSSNGTKLRKAYDSKARFYSRNATFWASSNMKEFLEDETGNVRWLCFEIDSIDFSYREKIDIKKVLSQAYRLYIDGYNCELTKDEIIENETMNIGFSKASIEEEFILKYFELDPFKERLWTAAEILNELTFMTSTGIKINVHSLGKALRKLKFEQHTARTENYDYPVKGYYLKKKNI